MDENFLNREQKQKISMKMGKTKYSWLLVNQIQKYVHHVDYGLYARTYIHTLMQMHKLQSI